MIFAMFLGLCVISFIVSKFLASVQPSLSSTLSSTHTSSSPNARLHNSTTTFDYSACHPLSCHNCNPTTSRRGIGQQTQGGVVGIVGNGGLVRQGQGGVGDGGNDVGNNVRVVSNVNIGGVRGASGGGYGATTASYGGTILFVGDLHWWTTDAKLETKLNKYGSVKEVNFFNEKVSGKSMGYCHVKFF
ncbi:hypothetical protein JHK82_030625 [Glycine max]|nr:hypothetical protein JHK85_031265 [Glycine max]KAG5123888.1 hypothetical protein JHK82_030625 [Glycine max]